MMNEPMEHLEQTTRVEKPWGWELWWTVTERYVGKVIFVNAGRRLSLQYHNQKDVIIMMGRKRSSQSKLFYHRINLEKRVRKDHILRMIDQNIDFDFVYKEVEHLEPKVMFPFHRRLF